MSLRLSGLDLNHLPSRSSLSPYLTESVHIPAQLIYSRLLHVGGVPEMLTELVGLVKESETLIVGFGGTVKDGKAHEAET